MADRYAAEILRQLALEEAARAAKVERIVAHGPPTGSGITAENWARWWRRGWVVCPGEKRDLVCQRVGCNKGAKCAKMEAKGLRGDGSPIVRRDRPACGAKTRAGGECRMRVEPGKKRCRLHGGLSTGPKTEAGRERIREAQRRRWAEYADRG